jgi:hypothetical protein
VVTGLNSRFTSIAEIIAPANSIAPLHLHCGGSRFNPPRGSAILGRRRGLGRLQDGCGGERRSVDFCRDGRHSARRLRAGESRRCSKMLMITGGRHPTRRRSTHGRPEAALRREVPVGAAPSMAAQRSAATASRHVAGHRLAGIGRLAVGAPRRYLMGQMFADFVRTPCCRAQAWPNAVIVARRRERRSLRRYGLAHHTSSRTTAIPCTGDGWGVTGGRGCRHCGEPPDHPIRPAASSCSDLGAYQVSRIILMYTISYYIEPKRLNAS